MKNCFTSRPTAPRCCITGYLSQYLQTIESVRSKIDSLASCLLFEIGVAIKTRGFIDLMVSLGLLIPAKMAQLGSQSDVVAAPPAFL